MFLTSRSFFLNRQRNAHVFRSLNLPMGCYEIRTCEERNCRQKCLYVRLFGLQGMMQLGVYLLHQIDQTIMTQQDANSIAEKVEFLKFPSPVLG